MGKQRKAMGKQSLFFNFLCSPQVLVRYNALLYDALRCLTSVKNEHMLSMGPATVTHKTIHKPHLITLFELHRAFAHR